MGGNLHHKCHDVPPVRSVVRQVRDKSVTFHRGAHRCHLDVFSGVEPENARKTPGNVVDRIR